MGPWGDSCGSLYFCQLVSYIRSQTNFCDLRRGVESKALIQKSQLRLRLQSTSPCRVAAVFVSDLLGQTLRR